MSQINERNENLMSRQHQQSQIKFQQESKEKDKSSEGKQETKETSIPKSRTPSDFQGEKSQGSLPGSESKMGIKPKFDNPLYKGSGKLQDKVAIITGADSGIGRSVAIFYAREGADVAVVYLNEDEDAEVTRKAVEKEGRRCLLIKGDLSKKEFSKQIVDQTLSKFGKIDILVNNAARQVEQEKIEDIDEKQLDSTFRTNIYSMFFLTQEVVKHMKEGSSIINTTSITSFKGKSSLLDYSSTKGAISTFTRSLAMNLASKGVRVNAVAPGPIWTPLIVSSFDEETISKFGKSTALGRAGQPEEMAPSYVFLASNLDSSYFTGQILHPNGGTPV